MPAVPLMQFIKYIPPLLGLVWLLEYQGGATIFGENLPIAYILVSAVALYWITYDATVQLPILFNVGEFVDRILHRCAFAFGVLAAVCVLSLLFLKYPFSVVPLIIWASLALVLVVWPIRGDIDDNLLPGGVITKLCALVANWWRGVNMITEGASSTAV